MRSLSDIEKERPFLSRWPAGVTALAPGSEGLACGYEDPQSVSRGSLSWAYPNSLHVIGAISRRLRRGGSRLRISIAVAWICSGTNSGWPRPRSSNSAPCSVRRRPNPCGHRSPSSWSSRCCGRALSRPPTGCDVDPRLGTPSTATWSSYRRSSHRRDRRRASHFRPSVRARRGTPLWRGCPDRRVRSELSAGRRKTKRARAGDAQGEQIIHSCGGNHASVDVFGRVRIGCDHSA